MHKLVDIIAALWYRLDKRHREITRRNLAFAYGPELAPEELERLARAVFRHFVRFGWEMVELLLAPLSHFRKKVVVLGEENVARALAKGRGVILLAIHAGNWEYTVMGYGLMHRSVTIVAREMDHPLLGTLVRYLRRRGGNTLVNKQRGLKDILAALKENRPVGILIDQNTTTEGGLLVDFFGKPTRTTPVAALLARRRDIAVIPSFSRRLPDGRHLVALFPPLPMEKTNKPDKDILRHLQEQSYAVEAWVREEPSQWLWLHRRWKNQFPELYKRR